VTPIRLAPPDMRDTVHVGSRTARGLVETSWPRQYAHRALVGRMALCRQAGMKDGDRVWIRDDTGTVSEYQAEGTRWARIIPPPDQGTQAGDSQ
jgi:hypothetical protein